MDYQQLLKKSDEEHKKTYTNDIYTPSKEESRKDSLSMDDIRYQYSNMKKKHIETSIIEQNMLKKKTHENGNDNHSIIKPISNHEPIYENKNTLTNDTVFLQNKYITDFSKQIVRTCINNSIDEIMSNYTYEQLLIDMYILFQSQKYNKKKISIHLLSFKYKLMFIVYSVIYNQTIYIQHNENGQEETDIENISDMDIINIKDFWLEKHTVPENIMDIYNDSLQNNYMSINSKIIYYNHKKKHQADWEDITLFTRECIQHYSSLLHKKKYIHIPNIDNIYFIYFIPIAIILHKKILFYIQEDIDSSSTFTIGDHTAKENKNIVIMNKYSNQINIYYDNSLFFNYTINQFITHSIKLKKEYMLGRLCSYISIRNNILYYKNYILQLPTTYILKQNILYIKKKNISSQNQNVNKNVKLILDKNDHLHFNYKNKRLLSITIKNDIHTLLSNKVCNRIFRYILLKYPICSQYKNMYNLENIYLFNNEEIKDPFINNSLFSMHFLIKKNKIILSYAECIHKKIQYVILELNNILNKKKIHLFQDNQVVEYILGHSKHLQYMIFNTSSNKMNIVTFLKKYGFCTIKKLHVYYYKYYNAIWSKKDIQHSVSMSSHIKKNHKSLNFGNHILIEMELDIGISIIMERTKQLLFYVKEHAMNRFKEKKIKIKKLNTYTHMDKIDQDISLIDLFIVIYKQNPDFIYFTTKFNCSSLALLISKNLLKNNVNEYIKLQNKLENATNMDHIMTCVKNVHKHTDKIYRSFPYSLVLYIVKTFSTKILDTFIITKKMLNNIKRLSIQKKEYIETMLSYTKTKKKHIGTFFKYTTEYEKNKDLLSYPNYLYLGEQIKYLCYSIGYYILMFYTYKKNIKDIIEDNDEATTHIQLKYICSTKDMNHINIISKKLGLSESNVIQLFLLKVFGIYFKHYYYIIHQKNCNYIIPYVHDSFSVTTLQSYMTLFLKNNYSQHTYFDLLLQLKKKNGYIFNKKEKYISITELQLVENIHNIKIDRLFYNTEEKNNPINITFMNINNIFEINVSYASNYGIIKDIFKKLFTIIELYAIQKDT